MHLPGQIHPGSEAFVKRMQVQIEKKPALDEMPDARRRALNRLLKDFEARYPRHEGMVRGYFSGQHTMLAIAEHFGVHYSTLSRMLKAYENIEG